MKSAGDGDITHSAALADDVGSDAESRSRYYEDLYRWFSHAVKIGVEISRTSGADWESISPEQLFFEARPYLKELFSFSHAVFLRVSEQDNSFALVQAPGDETSSWLQQEIDYLIEQGLFAWALNRSRGFVTPSSQGDKTFVLHPLATRTRIRGMFVGVIDQGSVELNEGSLSLLSMIMLNLSSVLEGIEVHEFVTQQNNNLEKIVAQRTGQLVEARHEAEEANRAKSRFLANMSHEIRTPLASVIGFAELLRDDALAEEERTQAVEAIVRTGRHLLDIINDILDLSKIESNRMYVEILPLSLFHLLDEIEALVAVQLRDRAVDFSIEYQYPLPVRIMTDPTRLKQILLNLCGNALKFTAEGSIRLLVACDMQHERILFSVIDTGIGIAGDKIERLFDSFTQADTSTTRKYGGTGLGLNICKRLAEQMGGYIDVESEPGVGSTFTVAVASKGMLEENFVNSATDLMVYRHLDGGQQREQVAVLAGRVLLAEDNPDNQNLVRYYLRKYGLDPEVVENGEQAVERALSEGFDLVLMDMQMPVMSGTEATEWLRKAGYRGAIVALTANATPEDRDQCLQAGCDGFLTKPIDQVQLHQTLQGFLAPGGASDEPGYDEEFARIREEFVAGLTGRIRDIQIAHAERDWPSLQSLAHQLKGSAGGFGYRMLGEAAGRLEGAVRARKHERCEALVTALVTAASAADRGEGPRASELS